MSMGKRYRFAVTAIRRRLSGAGDRGVSPDLNHPLLCPTSLTWLGTLVVPEQQRAAP